MSFLINLQPRIFNYIQDRAIFWLVTPLYVNINVFNLIYSYKNINSTDSADTVIPVRKQCTDFSIIKALLTGSFRTTTEPNKKAENPIDITLFHV